MKKQNIKYQGGNTGVILPFSGVSACIDHPEAANYGWHCNFGSNVSQLCAWEMDGMNVGMACDFDSLLNDLECTDHTGHMENPQMLATMYDDGCCMLLSCVGEGCTDVTACNYDSTVIIDDGSCEYEYDVCGICGGTTGDYGLDGIPGNGDTNEGDGILDSNFDCAGVCIANCGKDGICPWDANYITADTGEADDNMEDYGNDGIAGTADADGSEGDGTDDTYVGDTDCEGICGGTTAYDECGTCVDTTGDTEVDTCLGGSKDVEPSPPQMPKHFKGSV
jgi:hypothetical protein